MVLRACAFCSSNEPDRHERDAERDRERKQERHRGSCTRGQGEDLSRGCGPCATVLLHALSHNETLIAVRFQCAAQTKTNGGTTMRASSRSIFSTRALSAVVAVMLALFATSAAKAETRVYLLRGWFGVFSTGLDGLSQELRSKGIKAE